MGAIEALHILDSHNNPLLTHTYLPTPPLSSLLPAYLSHPTPRPPILHISLTQTLLYSHSHDGLLYLVTSSSDTDPLLLSEFTTRVIEALEDFLGAPLLASKIEGGYDVIAQILNEVCDAGTIDRTEPNALHEVIQLDSLLSKFLGGVGLPGNAPSLGPSNPQSRPSLQSSNSGPQIPWRRPNVRHTSNELYVDIIEALSVTLSPSGRPLAAFANGSIAFTSKVSGVPDLLLQLNLGKAGSGAFTNIVTLPVFHPCVRLAVYKQRPGELSFIPPDGKFVLMGYEVDLLGPSYLDDLALSSAIAAGAYGKPMSGSAAKLNLPVSASIQPTLSPRSDAFLVNLILDPRFSAASSGSANSSSGFGGASGLSSFGPGRKQQSTSAAPTIEDIVVKVAMPSGVRHLSQMRASKGQPIYSPGAAVLEWRISGRDAAGLIGNTRSAEAGVVATLQCTVVGGSDDDDDEKEDLAVKRPDAWDYTDDDEGYQSRRNMRKERDEDSDAVREAKKREQNKLLMPSSATVSFSVKGWLASGIKVEKLVLDQQRSKGLGSGVSPYKGVKYLTVSREGVEVRGN